MALQLTIQVHWCPDHVGIEGNKLADNLARKGLDIPCFPQDRYTSFSHLKESVRVQVLAPWRTDWTRQVLREEERKRSKGLGIFYRTSVRKHFPEFRIQPLNFKQHSRSTQSSYFQARTRIGNTLAYLHKIGKATTDQYNFCTTKRQIMEHLILHCPIFKERGNAFEGIKPRILAVLFKTTIGKEALLNFLRSSRCLITTKT